MGTGGQLFEEMKAAAFEGAAEGQVFEPTVRAGDAVEVGLRLCLHRSPRQKGQQQDRCEEAQVGSGAQGIPGELIAEPVKGE